MKLYLRGNEMEKMTAYMCSISESTKHLLTHNPGQ